MKNCRALDECCIRKIEFAKCSQRRGLKTESQDCRFTLKPCVKRAGTVVVEVLHFGADEIPLDQVLPHGELVLLGPPPQLAADQVHRGQEERRVQASVDVGLPPPLLNLCRNAKSCSI